MSGHFTQVLLYYILQHEDGSRHMLDYLIEDNNLLTVFNEYGLDEQDITFIKEQVAGPNKEFSQHHTGDHEKVIIL